MLFVLNIAIKGIEIVLSNAEIKKREKTHCGFNAFCWYIFKHGDNIFTHWPAYDCQDTARHSCILTLH